MSHAPSVGGVEDRLCCPAAAAAEGEGGGFAWQLQEQYLLCSQGREGYLQTGENSKAVFLCLASILLFVGAAQWVGCACKFRDAAVVWPVSKNDVVVYWRWC